MVAFRGDTKSFQHLFDMWLSTLETGAARLRSSTEIALKSPFLCACAKKLAFPVWFSYLRRFSVNIALDWVVRSAYHAGHKYDFW